MGVGQKIKAHLKNRGITQKYFAESINENRTLVSDYLNENLKPSIKFLEKAIDYFPELDLNYLFKGDIPGLVKEDVSSYAAPKTAAQIVSEIDLKMDEIKFKLEELKEVLSQK